MSNLLTSSEDIGKFLATINPDFPLFLDTETTGLHPWRGARICGMSMKQGDSVVFIPLRMDEFYGDLFTRVDNAHPGAIQQLQQGLRAGKKSMFNKKFDTNQCLADGIVFEGTADDPYIAASLILAGTKAADGKRQRLGLKAIARDILKIKVDEADLLEKWFESNGMGKNSERRYDRVPIDILDPYASADVVLLEAVHNWAQNELDRLGLRSVYNMELKATDVLASFEREGVKIDTGMAARRIEEFTSKASAIRKQLPTFGPGPLDPQRPEHLIAFFKSEGVVLTATTDKGKTSIDKKVLQGIDHPVARQVLEFRKYKKAIDFFAELIEFSDTEGFVHPSFNQFSSDDSPGRTSSEDPNMQNMPRSSDIGVRHVFVPPPGMKLVFGDFNQLHMRIAANIADEGALHKGFANGVDAHTNTASLIWGVSSSSVTKDQRKVGKDSNFTVQYGGGVGKLSEVMKRPIEEARKVYDAWHKVYPRIKAKLDECQKFAEKYGFVAAPSGRLRFLDEPRKAFNTIILGVEADVTKRALVILDKASRSVGGRAVNFVHDEVQLYLPEDMSDEKVFEMMREAEDHSGKTPLTIDLAYGGPSWGDKVDVKRESKTIVDMKGVDNGQSAGAFENKNSSVSERPVESKGPLVFRVQSRETPKPAASTGGNGGRVQQAPVGVQEPVKVVGVQEELPLEKEPKKWIHCKNKDGSEYDKAADVNDWTLKDLETEKAIMRIKCSDGTFIYIAGDEDVKRKYDSPARKIFLVNEVAEVIAIQKGQK